MKTIRLFFCIGALLLTNLLSAQSKIQQEVFHYVSANNQSLEGRLYLPEGQLQGVIIDNYAWIKGSTVPEVECPRFDTATDSLVFGYIIEHVRRGYAVLMLRHWMGDITGYEVTGKMPDNWATNPSAAITQTLVDTYKRLKKDERFSGLPVGIVTNNDICSVFLTKSLTSGNPVADFAVVNNVPVGSGLQKMVYGMKHLPSGDVRMKGMILLMMKTGKELNKNIPEDKFVWDVWDKIAQFNQTIQPQEDNATVRKRAENYLMEAYKCDATTAQAGLLVQILAQALYFPWQMEYMLWDGAKMLTKVQVPTLLLYPEHTQAMDVTTTSNTIRTLGNKYLTATVVEGVNEGFIPVSAQPVEVKNPDGGVSKVTPQSVAYFDALYRWLKSK